MKNILLATLLAFSFAATVSAATTRNDASCDIALLPAATLLLPYFEVDLDSAGGETTLFTITNASNVETVARVTLWTDRGYPVLTFNVRLTGYDAQSINLYDVLAHGTIARETARHGDFSDPNPSLGACDFGNALPPAELARVQSALTAGSIDGECEHVGSAHENAIGYATIDVVGNCSQNTPRDREYWRTDLRYDNILMGDYQQVASSEDFAQGGPLVHIRAVPEGGTPRSRRPSTAADFPRTFYSRFTANDARQPLPAQFAARWTEGTSLKIWREGRAGLDATCADFAADENLLVADVVTFDDQENGIGLDGRLELAAATRTPADDPRFPQLANGASNGWIYLNLDRSQRDDFASQAWVISSTRSEGRYSADVDAVALGNGCSAPVESDRRIAPSPDETNDDSCDIALLPAATLLLPYFEVDFEDPRGETTIFTLTNVGPEDRIARVTLWTDYSYPVISFNVFLTGYDVQSINLYDVIGRGLVAPDSGTGTQIAERGPFSDRNTGLDLDKCGRLPGPLPVAYVDLIRLAFTEGRVPELGDRALCNNVGNEHDRAVGYATIDVVRNCEENAPTSAAYWNGDIAWDNVLTGDYQQVHAADEHAQGSTLVHIRAIGEARDFPRTFYSRYQTAGAPKLDRRQPLPSVFAARWIEGGTGQFQTWLKIWREGVTGRDTPCARQSDNYLTYSEVARFDENENVVGDLPSVPHYPVPEYSALLPATSLVSVADTSVIPQLPNGSIAGWIYLNLDPLQDEDGIGLQNWVISSMRAEGRFAVDVDAIGFGNGCSAEVGPSEITVGDQPVAPLP